MLGAQGLLSSSHASKARTSLLFATVNVITSGFIANSIFTQMMESPGHETLAIIIETIPAMGLYRGNVP